MTDATKLYHDVIWELRKQIHELGLTMEQCDDVSGNQDGFTAKMLAPETKSGRQAQWRTVQNLTDSLMPLGYKLRIVPIGSPDEIRAIINRKLARLGKELTGLSYQQKIEKINKLGRMQMRDLARHAGRLGGLSRAKKLTPKQRQRIARKGGKARWLKRIDQRAAEITTTIEKGI